MTNMTSALRPRTLILFLGDIVFFTFSLWLSLFLRVFEVPTWRLFLAHLEPFSLLFVAWIAVFFIAGLYESRSIILERRAISMALLAAQLANVIIAALFFFFVPIFGIAPKTLLFIYLIVSLVLVFFWRVALFPKFGFQKKENALVVGGGAEVMELVDALHSARHAPTTIAAVIEPRGLPFSAEVDEAVNKYNPRFIIADFSNPEVLAAFPNLYNYLARGIRFFDALSLYEEVFGRVPLSVIDEQWLARNVSRYSHTMYDSVKRVIDFIIGLLGGIVSLILYPFIAAAILVESGFPVFIVQERAGEDNKLVRMYKFRTMQRNDTTLGSSTTENRVTAAGKVLRSTRLDELPQLWNIVSGDLSLIGPRPELPAGVNVYEKEIPYYNVRHLVKPGLSGWAQLYHDNHPHHQAQVEATREKLSYDLYYIKHRSLTLDVVVILKTIKKLLTRSGV
jgi:lipopolysaccharide/colanic/teichoic acid biosynthesis glycosyltransferase